MKKRIIATLMVGAVAVSCVAGLTACGNSVSVPKGTEISKDDWANAWAKTSELTNYTLTGSSTTSTTVKGSLTFEGETEEINSTSKMTFSMLTLYVNNEKNPETNKAYEEQSYKLSETSVVDGEKLSYTSEEVEKDYYEYSDKTHNWHADYSKASGQSDEGKSNSEEYWKANEVSSYTYARNSITYISSITDGYFYKSADAKAEDAARIVDLYESFTYSGGVYTATLYADVNSVLGDLDLPIEFDEKVEYKITLSFNSDKCLIGYSAKYDAKGTISGKDGITGSVNYTCKGNVAYAVTEIGTTDASKKATGDVSKALTKAKDEKAKSENN